jgi:hypothetical protein
VSRHAEKQQCYRQRLKARGLVQVQGWVTPPPADAIGRSMAELVGHDFPSFMKRRIIVFSFS